MRTILLALLLLSPPAHAVASDAYFANNGEMMHFYWDDGDGVFKNVPAILIDMQGRRVDCDWSNAGDGEAVILCNGKPRQQVMFGNRGFRYDGADFRALK